MVTFAFMIDWGHIDIVNKMRADAIWIVERGSVVYETVNTHSDIDELVIVPDKYKDFLSGYEKHIFEYHTTQPDTSTDIDAQYICQSDFQKLIDDYNVMAIETVCTGTNHTLYFNGDKCKLNSGKPFDKWKIRQSFSGTASNSWAKAHKKMTVEKDLDMYRGMKSLFHSLRILMFANQICETGDIYNFKEATPLWWEIYDHNDWTWEDFKAKYKPLYNKLRSKLAILAPKPANNV